MLSVVLRLIVLILLVEAVLSGPPPKPAAAGNATAHPASADAAKPLQHSLHPHIELPMHKPSALLSFGKAVADIPVAIVETCKDVAEGIASLVKGFFISLLNR